MFKKKKCLCTIKCLVGPCGVVKPSNASSLIMARISTHEDLYCTLQWWSLIVIEVCLRILRYVQRQKRSHKTILSCYILLCWMPYLLSIVRIRWTDQTKTKICITHMHGRTAKIKTTCQSACCDCMWCL